jgi:ribosomal protein L11 methyltransferase
MTPLQELVFETSQTNPEEISDALIALGALSVTVEDAAANADDEKPIFGEPGAALEIQAWPTCKVAALLDAQTRPEEFWRHFCAWDCHYESVPFEIRAIGDRDWVSETQRQFTPLLIDNRLWVGPHWAQAPNRLDPPAVMIQLDPGMAFGTGSHATTQLCLDFMLQRFRLGPTPTRVLDMGCGSGILAIAAAKLGAQEVIAVDIDPIAVQTTMGNAKNNQVTVHAQDAQAPIEGRFDLVVANILSQPLKLLAPALAAYAKPGASLFLSGILARQAQALLDIYQPLSTHLAPIEVLGEKEGWVCIGTRPH